MTYTKGPWFSDEEGRIWRRPLFDLYHRGGTISEDKPIAIVYRGWHGKNEVGYPVEANSRLIAAAPEMLEALKDCTVALKKAGAEGELKVVNAAISKAEIHQPLKKQFDFRDWHERQGFTYDSGALALGMGRTTYSDYLKKENLPKWLILACKAIDRGIKA